MTHHRLTHWGAGVSPDLQSMRLGDLPQVDMAGDLRVRDVVKLGVDGGEGRGWPSAKYQPEASARAFQSFRKDVRRTSLTLRVGMRGIRSVKRQGQHIGCSGTIRTKPSVTRRKSIFGNMFTSRLLVSNEANGSNRRSKGTRTWDHGTSEDTTSGLGLSIHSADGSRTLNSSFQRLLSRVL